MFYLMEERRQWCSSDLLLVGQGLGWGRGGDGRRVQQISLEAMFVIRKLSSLKVVVYSW